MAKYAEILRQVRAEVAHRPDALMDYLDALMLAANDQAEKTKIPGQKGTWLGIAHRIDRLMKELHPHIPR
jgi:hypothetical protein